MKGFDWNSLPEGSLVVDVGGGTGKPAVELARAFPHLTFVVQDQESVVQKALEVKLFFSSQKYIIKRES
jgi:ubiquinone/menaquinone biosynthesis C-methylase UbiE